MSNYGPEAKEATTAFWDIAGHIYNAVSGSAKEAVQAVAEEVKEEIKEVAKSPSIVDATKAAAINIVEDAAPVVVDTAKSVIPAMFTPIVDQCSFADRPGNLTLLSDALGYCLPEMNSTAKAVVQEGSSYLPYLATAATLFTGGFAAYKLRGTKATLGTVMQDKASYGIIEGSIEILKALNELMKNPTVVEIIKLLTPVQAAKLLENQDTLAEIATLKDATQQILAIQTLLTPAPVVVSSAVADLNDVLRQVASSSSSVEATQSAPVDLAASILTSDAGKQVLAKIRGSEKANAVLEQMNEKSLKTLNANAAKFIASPKFAAMNDATLAGLLIQTAAAAKQTIELEAKKTALKM